MDDEIRLVEERLRRAMLASDCAVLDELIAPELVFTTHLGQVIGKEDDLAAHRGGVLKFHAVELSEAKLQVDAGLAVVSVRTQVAGTFAEAPFAEDLRFTRVWRRTGGHGWRVVAGHSCRIQSQAS